MVAILKTQGIILALNRPYAVFFIGLLTKCKTRLWKRGVFSLSVLVIKTARSSCVFFFCFWKADAPVVDLGTACFTLHTRTRDPTTCKYERIFRREQTLVTLATQTNVDSPKTRAFPRLLSISLFRRKLHIARIRHAYTLLVRRDFCMCTRTNYSKQEFLKLSAMSSCN